MLDGNRKAETVSRTGTVQYASPSRHLRLDGGTTPGPTLLDDLENLCRPSVQLQLIRPSS